jgi:hypothetical protein
VRDVDRRKEMSNWRKARAIDFRDIRASIWQKGTGHEPVELYNSGWEIGGFELRDLCSALSIDYQGERYTDAHGKSRISYPSIEITPKGYDKTWQPNAIYALIEAPGLVHVRTVWGEDDQASEEFSYSGDFTVWWSED